MVNLKRLGLLTAAIVLVMVLAACGGDEEPKDDAPVPDASPLVGEWTPAPGEGPGPVAPEIASLPDPTNTPYVPPPELEYQSAGELARIDLSTRLSVAPDQIDVLEADAELFLDDPLDCPVLPDEDLDAYYVYLQHEQNVYPYQAYEDPAAGAVVAACADVMVDQGVLFVPTPSVRDSLVERIRADLEARGVDATRGEFRVMRAVTWTDAALGCRGEPGETPTPAFIAGYLVIYVVGGVPYEYHTDSSGERLEFCAPPEGFETADKLIAVLQEDEDLEVVVVEGEEAAYAGLEEVGVLIEMTADAYRVGLFDFDTNTQARRAAQRVNDASVSHILVSGNVLIVQEENSPAVYSTLLNYAEEIRTPLLEDDAIPEDEAPDDESAPSEDSSPTLPPTPDA